MLERSLIMDCFLLALTLEVAEENITIKPILMKTYERGSEYFHEKRSFLNKFTFK